MANGDRGVRMEIVQHIVMEVSRRDTAIVIRHHQLMVVMFAKGWSKKHSTVTNINVQVGIIEYWIKYS